MDFERLDDIARDAWRGNYDGVEVLSTGERLYVALASGRMHELAPSDPSPTPLIASAPEAMAHMLTVWRGSSRPKD